MSNKMKNAYYLLFYKFYCFFKAIADEGWEHWKALIAINTLWYLVIIELLVWWTIVTKVGIDIPAFGFAIPVALGVTVFNYYMLLHEKKWKVIYEQFKRRSIKAGDKLSTLLIVLFVVFVLESFVFSFYRMSLIDWSDLK